MVKFISHVPLRVKLRLETIARTCPLLPTLPPLRTHSKGLFMSIALNRFAIGGGAGELLFAR